MVDGMSYNHDNYSHYEALRIVCDAATLTKIQVAIVGEHDIIRAAGFTAILTRLYPVEQLVTVRRGGLELITKSGSLIKCYAQRRTERLRGPNFHLSWVIEDTNSDRPIPPETLETLEYATRAGDNPRIIHSRT